MNNDQFKKNIDDTINSFDGAGKAEPKPFLYTRLMAKMNKEKETVWDRVGKVIARPAVWVAGLCLIISINAMIILNNSKSGAMDQASTTDEFSTTMATLYNFENAE